MTGYNSDNKRIKRDYFRYPREAQRRNEASVDGDAKALGGAAIGFRQREIRNYLCLKFLGGRATQAGVGRFALVMWSRADAPAIAGFDAGGHDDVRLRTSRYFEYA